MTPHIFHVSLHYILFVIVNVTEINYTRIYLEGMGALWTYKFRGFHIKWSFKKQKMLIKMILHWWYVIWPSCANFKCPSSQITKAIENKALD